MIINKSLFAFTLKKSNPECFALYYTLHAADTQQRHRSAKKIRIDEISRQTNFAKPQILDALYMLSQILVLVDYRVQGNTIYFELFKGQSYELDKKRKELKTA